MSFPILIHNTLRKKMKFLRTIAFFSCLLFITSCVFQSKQKRAQKNLEKGRYEKAERLLNKSLAKDSLNPAARFLYSELYLDTAWRQHIDSAQFFILRALAELDSADKKDLKRLQRIGADSSALRQQLAAVDSAAFRRATDEHSIEAYNYFISQYAYARQLPEATRRRNALAFRAAEEKNTYQAYQKFFLTYPEAAEAAEARERYEELLFIVNTQTGTLDSYTRFLDTYPDTPYRNRLLKNIYLLSTARHKAAQYARFIEKYPDNSYTREAVNQLYHLHKQLRSPGNFLAEYPGIPFRDSLDQVTELEKQPILAVLEEGRWHFINDAGRTILPPEFMDVHPGYLCETIEADYVEAIKGSTPVVVAKNGHTILEQDYEKIDDIGWGLLRIQQNGQKGLYLKSGRRILPPAYEKIELFNESFLHVKEYGKHGILTHNGQWLAEPIYDSLARLENFVLLFKDKRMAVSSSDKLVRDLQMNDSTPAEFKYVEAYLADSAHLIVHLPDGRKTVLDRNLQTLIPPAEAQIRPFQGGWLLEDSSNKPYKVLDTQGNDLLNSSFRDIRIREPWIAYKTDSLWGLYHLGHQKATFDVYDSLTLLHSRLMVVHKGKQTNALFFSRDTVSVDLSGTDSYRLLRPVNRREVKDQAYLLVTDGNAKKIYNLQGKLIEQGRYKEIIAPDNQLIMLKTAKGAAIADSSGNILLKPIYDAVGNYQDGYFATLEKSKFGIFNHYKNIHIPPRYKAALRPYSDSLLMASIDKGWGIIDINNKRVLNFEYQDLQYWSDSVVLALKDKEWHLINLRTGQTEYGPFEYFKFIEQSPQETLARISTESGYGVYSSTKGEIIAPTFDEVVNLGTVRNPLFYCEKKIKEADMFVVMYINGKGDVIYKQVYPRDDWYRVICE